MNSAKYFILPHGTLWVYSPFSKELGCTEASKINFMKQNQSQAMKDHMYKAKRFLNKLVFVLCWNGLLF